MFFRKVVRKSNGKEYAYLKLIKTYREDGKVKHKVIANLGNIDNLTSETVVGLINGLAKIYGLPNHYLNQALRQTGTSDPVSARDYERSGGAVKAEASG
ncbi:MAG: hypothetical protein AB1815_11590 [Bacillota bacterium]